MVSSQNSDAQLVKCMHVCRVRLAQAFSSIYLECEINGLLMLDANATFQFLTRVTSTLKQNVPSEVHVVARDLGPSWVVEGQADGDGCQKFIGLSDWARN